MRLWVYGVLGLIAAAMGAAPASAKAYFFCYYWSGSSYEERTVVALTKIMEADVDRIDEYRLGRIWSQHASPGYAMNSPYPGIREARGGSARSNCVTSYNRASLDKDFTRHYLPTYRYELIEWSAIPADIVPQARVANPNELQIAVPSATRPETPKVEPKARAEQVDTPAGKILMSPEKKADYEAKLAEHQRQLGERERAIADAAARHAANKAAAEAQVAQHNKELAEHRETVAQMERHAAAVRAEWAQRAAGADAAKPDEERVEFKEGIVLCNQPNPSLASFSCKGPLQNVSTKLDVPEATVALGQACGSDRSIRDLGMVKGFRAFGCGFGIHPTARDYPGNTDVPAQLGVDYIPGRGAYFCPKSKLAYCRG